MYQGEKGRPGLKSLETLLPSIQLLEKLAAKYPMAVVTGRPKSDCDFALQTFGLTHLFKVCTAVDVVVVCCSVVQCVAVCCSRRASQVGPWFCVANFRAGTPLLGVRAHL